MQNLDSIKPSTIPALGTVTDDSRVGPKLIRWTSDEYYQIAELGVFEGKRVELIEGEIIEMAPMGSIHATGISLVTEVLREHFRQGFHIRSQAPLDVDVFSQPEPDVAVVKGSPRDYSEGHPRTLLLAVEISVSSLGLDRDIKTRLYAKAKIEDYWIVNLSEKCVEVYRKPTFDPDRGYIYLERMVYGENESLSPLAKPDASIEISDMLP